MKNNIGYPGYPPSKLRQEHLLGMLSYIQLIYKAKISWYHDLSIGTVSQQVSKLPTQLAVGLALEKMILSQPNWTVKKFQVFNTRSQVHTPGLDHQQVALQRTKEIEKSKQRCNQPNYHKKGVIVAKKHTQTFSTHTNTTHGTQTVPVKRGGRRSLIIENFE